MLYRRSRRSSRVLARQTSGNRIRIDCEIEITIPVDGTDRRAVTQALSRSVGVRGRAFKTIGRSNGPAVRAYRYCSIANNRTQPYIYIYARMRISSNVGGRVREHVRAVCYYYFGDQPVEYEREW
jgi:hypothetical protein